MLTEHDREIFDAIVPADHYLRRVKQAIDFPVPAILASCYNPTLGRPAIEPLLLLKLEFLQFQYGLSDREVIAQSQVNMAYRFFLDLSLKSALPDPSLLSYFRAAVGRRSPSADLSGSDRPGAATRAGQGPVAAQGCNPRPGQHRGPLDLDPGGAGARPTPGGGPPLRPGTGGPGRGRGPTPADRHRRPARRGTVGAPRDPPAGVGGLGRRTAPATGAAGVPTGDPVRPRLRRALDLAHKVLHDRDDPEASDKVVSVHDSEARKGWHHQWFAGYLLDIAMDADREFITAIDVLPAEWR